MSPRIRFQKFMQLVYLLCIAAGIGLASPCVHAQVDLDNLTPRESELLKEHVYGGLPSRDNIYIRQAYILSFRPETRTPSWVAYHIVPDYRNTPSRKGRFKSFRADPEVSNEARNAEYNGLMASRGYARGHLAPFGIMGGDRDGDGKYAEYDKDDSSHEGDAEDAQTVYQGNFMSNIAPQHHEGFNGWENTNAGRIVGLWYELERWIQDDLVRNQEEEVWIFAGCIFGEGEHEKVGPSKNIWVPSMFYKILVIEDENADVPVVLAYLLPHQRKRHGDLDSFLVSVDVVEALAGIDLFTELDLSEEEKLLFESEDTWNNVGRHFETE